MSTLRHQFIELVKDFSGKQIEKVIEQILQSDLYITSEFLAYPNIQKLNSPNNSNKYYNTLYLFSMLDYQEYKKDPSKYLSLDNKLMKKLKSISLLEMAKKEKILYVDDLKKRLEVGSNFEVEEILFNVISNGLISGKADLRKGMISIVSVVPRGNLGDLQKVEKTLDKWINNINEAEDFMNRQENEIKNQTIENRKILSIDNLGK